ncbi:MAG: glycosyltransferase family 4 protein [Hasllibacter sp.]
MAFDGIGPAHTCARLFEGLSRAGLRSELYVGRLREAVSAGPVRTGLPRPLGGLPYRHVGGLARRRIERAYLRSLSEGDVAYLWPAASLALHRRLARRGIPIVQEAINTRMARAKAVLDQAYDELGMPPRHGITAGRIAEEEEKYALSDAIFCPSPATEDALRGHPLAPGIMPASYGVASGPARPAAGSEGAGSEGAGPVFLFVGFAGVRKGFPALLEAWRGMPPEARLRVAGRLEDAVRDRYADILDRPNVELLGFRRDVRDLMRTADAFVLPSLEEGDALVTYEAADAGLPIVATAEGGGRFADETGCVRIVPAKAPEELLAEMRTLAASREDRAELGRRTRAAALDYTWDRVAARRADRLRARFAGLAV